MYVCFRPEADIRQLDKWVQRTGRAANGNQQHMVLLMVVLTLLWPRSA